MTGDVRAATQVVELITGGWRAQALYTAVKLGLPDHIEAGRATDAELAAASGAKEEGIHRLMRLLVAMGVFTGSGAGYRNTAVSRELLDRPGSQRDMCLLYGEDFYAPWAHAEEAIGTVSSGFEIAYGRSFYAYLSEHRAMSERFQGAMRAGNVFFDAVPGVFDFAGKRVVDLGGGSGQLLSTILAAAPDATGTLLDRPNVVATAGDHLASVGLDRVELIGGDMFAEVPPGGDVYLLCRVLAGHSDDAVVGLFNDIRRNLTGPAARLLLLDRLVTDEGSTVLPALWDLHLLMTTGGRHRTLAELRTLLGRAGLEIERSAALPVETTALIVRPRQ